MQKNVALYFTQPLNLAVEGETKISSFISSCGFEHKTFSIIFLGYKSEKFRTLLFFSFSLSIRELRITREYLLNLFRRNVEHKLNISVIYL